MAPSKLVKVMYKAKKIAIVAASFNEFLDKSRKEFDLSAEVEIVVYSADGFKINEESFVLLGNETVLIISVGTKNEMIENVKGVVVDAQSSSTEGNSKQSPLKNNTTESPPKKRSKKDMYEVVMKNNKEDPFMLATKAMDFITDLEKDNEELQKKVDELESETRTLINVLTVLEHIDVLERKFFPLWLLQSDLSRKWRWILCIRLKLTLEIAAITARPEYNSQTPELIAETIVKVYGEASVPAYRTDTDLRDVDEEQWDQIFNFLNLTDKDDRIRFRLIARPITTEERKKFHHLYNTQTKELDYVFDVQFFEDRPLNAAIVRNVCSPNSGRIRALAFVKDESDRLTNRVFILFVHLNWKLMSEIKETLQQHCSVKSVTENVARDE